MPFTEAKSKQHKQQLECNSNKHPNTHSLYFKGSLTLDFLESVVKMVNTSALSCKDLTENG